MNLDQAILEKVRVLPAEKQREVLDFVEFLHSKTTPGPGRRRSVLGLLADYKTEISAEDIAQARREMWGNFPRDMEA